VRLGWWTLFVFTGFGLALEYLHAFKSLSYVSSGSETRRLLWTLSHAHGTLMAVINIVLGLQLRVQPAALGARVRIVSSCLIAATILLPGGFFLGGVSFYAGDQGLGSLAIPAGAILLLVALLFIARSASAALPEAASGSQDRRQR
jgi:hypothetical protein